MSPQHPKDLVFSHSNLYKYLHGETKMCDIARDKFDLFEDDVRVFEVTNLSLDKSELEIIIWR